MGFPLDTQESEENFDLALIASLEIDVVPHLGDSRVPDYLILRLGKVLYSGSQLQQPEDGYNAEAKTPTATGPGASKSKSRNGEKPSSKPRNTVEVEIGSTKSGKLVPRERFSYWCFDLLLLICSDQAKGIVSHDPGILSAKHKQTGSQVGGGSPQYASPSSSVVADLHWWGILRTKNCGEAFPSKGMFSCCQLTTSVTAIDPGLGRRSCCTS